MIQTITDTDARQRRFSKVKTDVLQVDGHIITARVEQFDRPGDKVYTAKELVEFGKAVFSHLPEGYQVRYRPLVFKGTGIDAVSAEWVKNNLKKFKLRQSDLCEDFGIDKHVMSKLLSGQYSFTRWHRACFYYYFQYQSCNAG